MDKDEIVKAMMGETSIKEQTSSEANSESTSETPEPKTYTDEELKKMVSDRLAEQGRKHKEELESLKKERDEALKAKKEIESKSQEIQSEIETREKKISDLEADLETALDEDDRDAVKKLKKRITDQEEQLKKDYKDKAKALDELRTTLEKEREEWAGTVAEARQAKFEVDLLEVANEYEGGNMEKLKMLCDKAGTTKKNDIKEFADLLWSKKAESKEEVEKIKVDSGVTSGSTGGLTIKKVQGMSPSDILKNYKEIAKMNAYTK